MNDPLKMLMKQAKLEIIEFGIDRHVNMKTFHRTLPFHVMSFHKTGKANLRIGEQIFTILPGTVVYIPSNVEHDHYQENFEETAFLWWHFHFHIAGVMDVMKMFQIPIIFTLQDSEKFETIFREYYDLENHNIEFPSIILIQAKALELFYILIDNATKQKESYFLLNNSETFLTILLRIIQNPIMPLSLKQLSKELHMHPTYICNRFKELFGKSPMQMQREAKIHKAKMLLCNREMTVSEISNMLGFSQVQNFTRLFKTYVGLSPSQFRDFGEKNTFSGVRQYETSDAR